MASVKINVKGNWKSDFIDSAQAFISSNPSWSGVTAKEFEKIREKLGLVWHHHEDLETMVLLPQRIHAGVGHWGSVSVIKKMVDEKSARTKSLWRRILGL